MQKSITYEHLILNRKTEVEELTQVEFGLSGDSGSLLVNRFGQKCNIMDWHRGQRCPGFYCRFGHEH